VARAAQRIENPVLLQPSARAGTIDGKFTERPADGDQVMTRDEHRNLLKARMINRVAVISDVDE
jgi:hypothetical protein